MKIITTTKRALLAAATLALTGMIQPPILRAADHGDGPTVASDQGCDLADLYAFLDPGDNSQVVLICTLRGFIVPSEAGNFANFDPAVRLRFNIENTGDAKPDIFIDVNFSKREIITGATAPSQKATVAFSGKVPSTLAGAKGRFLADVTQPTLANTAPTPAGVSLGNLKNPTPGISFFAGEVDDPFFFDIVGFNRFTKSVVAHFATTMNPPAIDFTTLDRARDSFAGYNVMSVALRMPASILKSTKEGALTKIGVSASSGRKTEHTVKGAKVGSGAYAQVDREGIPGANVVFIGYNRKNEYNGSTTLDDANGKFTPDIAATLTSLGTDSAHIGILAGVAGIPLTAKPTAAQRGTGDFLRLQLDPMVIGNSGNGGGDNAGAGFPNGRRLKDDVIDTVLFLVTNEALTTGDKVGASDVAPQNAFPFVATPQQPRVNGTVEDNTRN